MGRSLLGDNRNVQSFLALFLSVLLSGCSASIEKWVGTRLRNGDSQTTSPLLISVSPVTPTVLATTDATISWSLAGSASEFIVDLYAGASCAGTALSTETISGDSTSKIFSGLTSGVVYSAKVTPKKGSVVGTSGCSSTFVVLQTYTVDKVYPSNSDWNSYIKDDDRSVDQYSQTDDACDGTETGAYTCIHGGELRKVTVTGQSSCTDLTLTESLGVFEWECKVKSGTATFFTKKLKTNKGLKDLLDATSWKSNSVTLYQNSIEIGSSISTTWGWTNAVVALPDNSATANLVLDGTDSDGAGPDDVFTAGTLFTLSSSRSTPGYELGLDGMGIVTLGTSELSWNGTATDNCGGAGQKCLVYTGWSLNANRLWFEGLFNGYNAAGTVKHIVRPWTSNLTTIKNATLKNSTETGIYDRWSSLVRIIDVSITGTAYAAILGNEWETMENIEVYNVDGGIVLGENSRIANCRVANEKGASFYGSIYTATGASVQNCVVSNGKRDGISTDGLNTTFVGILAHNIDRHGVTFRSGGESRATMTHVTTANNTFPFNFRSDGDYVTLANAYIMDSTIDLDGDNNKIANLAFSGTLNTYATTVNNVFSANLLFSNGAQCNSSLGTNPGLANGTCATQGSSSHTAHSGLTVTGSINAEVLVDDSSNASDSSGSATYATTLDWTNFDYFLRGWGRDGATLFPDASNIAHCDAVSTNCAVWDFRLKSNDTTLKNRSGAGNTALENEDFAAGTACPTAVDGNRAISDNHQRDYYFGINALEDNAAAGGDNDGICESGEKCYNQFLINAVEIYGDRIGDEDGLCESDEACIYSPNFGAYQGEGEYEANGTCTFQDGLVTGVIMYAYPTN